LALSFRGHLSWLREQFRRPLDLRADRIRLLSQWEPLPQWEPLLTGDDNFDTMQRWNAETLGCIVGDYGSGKSTFTSILAMKLTIGPTLKGLGRDRMSICAWEEDRADFEDRARRFACGGDPLKAEAKLGEAIHAITNRIHWFEPDADPERFLKKYLDDVRWLTTEYGVLIHVCDPWNSFHHETEAGETETKYAERMLGAMQAMVRELGITILVVCHLPKLPFNPNGIGAWRPFRVGEAHGSKQFANKADVGICVVRTTRLAEAFRDCEEADQALKELRVSAKTLDDIRAKIGMPQGGQHMVVSFDKIRSEGMGPTKRGIRGVRAFVIDHDASNLKLDPAATELAARAWR